MVDAAQIKEHAEIIGSDGVHVGTVDHMDGADKIKLTKKDRDAGGRHHYIPLSWVAGVEGGKIKLNKPSRDAEASWQTT